MKGDINKVKKKIDALKNLLNKQLESDDIDREKVLSLSEKLDIYILEYYKISHNKSTDDKI